MNGFSGPIQGDGWAGDMMVSSGDITHIYVRIHSTVSTDIVTCAMEYIYGLFADGRERFLRCKNVTDGDVGFETDPEPSFVGVLRFSFYNHSGEERKTIEKDDVLLTGFGGAQDGAPARQEQ